MQRLSDLARFGRDLHRCPRCRKPFVAAREVLSSHAREHVVDLACANCGWHAVERHDEARLRALGDAVERDSAQIESAAGVLALALELELIDRFSAALRAGHILPEDF